MSRVGGMKSQGISSYENNPRNVKSSKEKSKKTKISKGKSTYK